MKITNQIDLSLAFWRDNPGADSRKIPNYSGDGQMFKTDTRCAFSDYIDTLRRDGAISAALAQRATLKNKPGKFYINCVGNGYRETIDEFATRKEARAMIQEYRMAYPGAHHYISGRACGNWIKS